MCGCGAQAFYLRVVGHSICCEAVAAKPPAPPGAIRLKLWFSPGAIGLNLRAVARRIAEASATVNLSSGANTNVD